MKIISIIVVVVVIALALILGFAGYWQVIQEAYNKEGAIMEIYDIPGKRIVYRKEIVKRINS